MTTIQNADEARALLECRDRRKWSSLLFGLAERHGFPSVFFAIKQSRAASFHTAFVETNLSPRWRRIYERERFAEIDPVVAHCRGHAYPLNWDAGTFVTERERLLYERARFHGLVSGIAYPVPGLRGEAGILCFASPVHGCPGPDVRASLALVRDYVCESHRRFALATTVPPSGAPTPLTPRELECLQWVTAGKTSWEMAQILSCSEATINFHISNVTRKFGVQTRSQAAIRAISEGIVIPGQGDAFRLSAYQR